MHYEKFSDGSVKCIESEIPFDIPNGWEWSRLSTICYKLTDGTHHSPNNFPSGDFKYITAKNIKESGIDLTEITYIEAKVHKEIYARCNPEYGDVLYIKDGATSGIATVNNLNEAFSLLSSVALLKPAKGIDSWYMCNAMQSSYFYNTTREDMKGVGITRITLSMLSSRLIPIPPSIEQNRIAQKFRSLICIINGVETDKELLKEAIRLLKNKILDLAIRGKLVSQNPNDESASVLLERIHQEKEELIKAGKLKRDKRESIIFRGDDNSYYEKFSDGTIKCIDDELPFMSPKNWVWCELQDCCSKEIKRGRAPKYADEGNILAFAQKCNRKTGEIDISTALWLDRASTNRYSTDEYMLDGDIVINSTGTGTLGRIGIYHNNDNPHHIPIVPDSHVTVVRAAKNIEPSYLFFYLKFMQRKIEEMGEGSTNQKELKPLTIQKIRLPIPPYEEQQRIVKLVHSITRKLSSIEESLTLMH